MCGESHTRYTGHSTMVKQWLALCQIGPLGKPNLPETLFREDCTFPKLYFGKVLPPRNANLEQTTSGGEGGQNFPERFAPTAPVSPRCNHLPGRLYLPETLFQEGCTFPKPYSGKAVPSRNPTPERLYLPKTVLGR